MLEVASDKVNLVTLSLRVGGIDRSSRRLPVQRAFYRRDCSQQCKTRIGGFAHTL